MENLSEGLTGSDDFNDDFYRQMTEALQGLPEENLPDGLHESVMNSIRAQRAIKRPRAFRLQYIYVAACLFATVITSGVLVLISRNEISLQNTAKNGYNLVAEERGIVHDDVLPDEILSDDILIDEILSEGSSQRDPSQRELTQSELSQIEIAVEETESELQDSVSGGLHEVEKRIKGAGGTHRCVDGSAE